MPRPRMRRNINFQPQSVFFKPRGVPMADLDIIVLTHEEMEALKLRNINGLDQTEAAVKMNTSQSTFQRILTSAYQKISEALVNGKAIEIIE